MFITNEPEAGGERPFLPVDAVDLETESRRQQKGLLMNEPGSQEAFMFPHEAAGPARDQEPGKSAQSLQTGFNLQRPTMSSLSSFPLEHELQPTAYLKVPLLPATVSFTKVSAGIVMTLSPETNGERVNLRVTSVPSAISVTSVVFEILFFRLSDLHVPLSQKK